MFKIRTETLTGELIGLARDLKAHAAGAAAVEATQFEGGASVSRRVRGKNHGGPSAPPWDDLQQPNTTQKTHLKSTWKENKSQI